MSDSRFWTPDLDEKISRLQAGFTRVFSLIQMEAVWLQFVEECEEGYGCSIYEFDNDSSVRDRIDLILGHEDLFGVAAVERLRAETVKLDERFRALLRTDVTIRNDDAPWWQRGVLKYAGEEYAQNVRSEYGIEIEVR